MKISLLLLTCLLFKFSTAQDRVYTFKEVGWTISLPSDYRVLDSAEIAAKSEKGKKAIEDANDVKTDISDTKTLISATKNRFNIFNSTITPYDPDTDGDFEAVSQGIKEAIYKTLKESMEADFDTVSSVATIDGLDFDKFLITVNIKGKALLHMALLTKLYKGYDFGITYLYMDDSIRDEIESMLSNSKFSSSASSFIKPIAAPQKFNFQKIRTSDIESLRAADGARFVTYDYFISASEDYFPGRPAFDLAQPLIYQKTDGPFQVETSFYFSKGDSTVRLIEYQWEGTRKLSEAEFNDIIKKNTAAISAQLNSSPKLIPETKERAAKDIWENKSIYVQQLHMPDLRRIRVLVSWK